MERRYVSLYIAPPSGRLKNCVKGKAVFLNELCVKIVHDSLENSCRIFKGQISTFHMKLYFDLSFYLE